MKIYILSGLLAAVAGFVLMGRQGSANALMGDGMELQSIAAVVIGGTNLFGGEGKISGTVIGMLVIGVLSNGLAIMGVAEFWQRVVNGLIIVAVVALDQWRRRRRGWRRREPARTVHHDARPRDRHAGAERKLTERRLADLDGLFAEPVDPARRDELAYTVSEIPAPHDGANLPSSTTVIRPGRVGERVLHDQGPLPCPARPRGDLRRAERRGTAGDGDRGRASVSRGDAGRGGSPTCRASGRTGASTSATSRSSSTPSIPVTPDTTTATIESQGFPVLVVAAARRPGGRCQPAVPAMSELSWRASTSARPGPRRRSTRPTASRSPRRRRDADLARRPRRPGRRRLLPRARAVAGCVRDAAWSPAGVRAIGVMRADGRGPRGRCSASSRRPPTTRGSTCAAPARWTALDEELGERLPRDVGLPGDGQPRAEDALVEARASPTAFDRTRRSGPARRVRRRAAGRPRRAARRSSTATYLHFTGSPTRGPASGRTGARRRRSACRLEQLPRDRGADDGDRRARRPRPPRTCGLAGGDAGRGRAGGHRGRRRWAPASSRPGQVLDSAGTAAVLAGAAPSSVPGRRRTAR